jgi:hypothetical protein
MNGAVTSMVMLDPLLRPGSNVLSIEWQSGRHEPEALEVRVLREGEDVPVAMFVWPEMAPSLEEHRRDLPLFHEVRFDLDDWVELPAHATARPMSFGCEGLPEQHALIRRFHEVLAQSDYPGFIELVRFRTEATFVARSRHPDFEPALIAREYAEFFDRRIEVRPLDLAALHFEPCAGGRACYVRRFDDAPAIQAVALSQWAVDHPEAVSTATPAPSEDDENMELAMDLVLLFHDGAWRIFR